MNKNDNKEKFIEKMKDKYGSLFTYEKLNYNNNNKMVMITCVKHGDFLMCAKVLLTKRDPVCPCILCTRQRHFAEFKQLAFNVHKNKYNYSKSNFINATTKIEIVCEKHGSFFQEPYMHYAKKQGCKQCAIENGRTGQDEFINKAKQVHGSKYDYSDTVYTKISEYINILCPTHGVFKQRAGSHLSGNGCTKCNTDRTKLGIEKFIEISNTKHNGKYSYINSVYSGNKRELEIICPTHGVFRQKPNAHMSGAGCPRCISSKGENEIARILTSHNISYIREYVIPGSQNRYRYDFFIKDLNVLIEFHGHQHYFPVERFGGLKGHIACKARDKKKKILAKKNNIHLIEIHYSFLYNKSLEKKILKEIKRCQKKSFL